MTERGAAPSERIRLGNDYYLLASALPPRGRRLLLNDRDTFAIFDEAGDIPLASFDTLGLFCRGTRFAARLELRVNGAFPFLLSSGAAADGSELLIHLTNPDERRGGELILQRDTVALRRRLALVDGVLSQTIDLHNYGAEPVTLQLQIHFAVDFADIFELRGVERERRGVAQPPRIGDGRVRFDYTGLDGIERCAEIELAPMTWQIAGDQAALDVRLDAGEQARAALRVHCRAGDNAPRADFDGALAELRERRCHTARSFAAITSNDGSFNEWIDGSIRDLSLLCRDTERGPVVYAGIPWFATVFGRDALITAFETLAFAPSLAAGVLRGLAAVQGSNDDPERDEQPGKILHELRDGEMAATGEVPFGRYYGSIDATPLFAWLLAAYTRRTADLALAGELWPAACAAMDWIDANVDAAGYLAYCRYSTRGLVNQGWKDSHDSIFRADGAFAEAPIALCEVQGYVYAARVGLAAVARRLGHDARAAAWSAGAAALRERFERDFWLPERDCYALAIDGAGRVCSAVTSNAGQCLLAGIAAEERGQHLVERLMRDDCFCGWGIRTLSSAEPRYNPMSYHNGSVWPHDNALIAAGFSAYGRTEEAVRILGALFAVSLRQDDRRLPELFCGFARTGSEAPVSYPVACRPQAWAAGSVFLLIQAALGLEIDAWEHRVTFSGAVVPRWLDYIDIRGMEVDGQRIDVRVRRGGGSAAIEVLDRCGDVEILVRK